jgi:hypothetical protein
MESSARSLQRSVQTQSPLLSLPAELVVLVVEWLANEPHSLCSLARTCQLLQPIAEEHIYTAISLVSTDELRAIINAFTTRPERVESVQNLKLLYKFHDGLGATIDVRQLFNAHVGHMKSLKEWHVESPYDNFKWNSGGHEWVQHDMESVRISGLYSGCLLSESIPSKWDFLFCQAETYTRLVLSFMAPADFGTSSFGVR